MTKPVEAAKAIRKLLKEMFPKAKFSVTSDSYSMGDAVRITSPIEIIDQVREVTKPFQAGSVDPYEDIYNFDAQRDDIPQTKFVLVSKR